MIPEKILEDIRKKRELEGIDKNYVSKLVSKELQKNKKLLLLFEKTPPMMLLKKAEYEKLKKTIRAQLRKSVGMFVNTKHFHQQRKKLLEELAKTPNSLNIHEQLLSLHQSTKERLPDYPTLYKKIFAITGKPEKIIDLGCGINPVSYPFMGFEKIEYNAYDINAEDIEVVKTYFEIKKIKGKAEVLDISEAGPALLSKLPKSDVCFLFKVLESLESKDHKLSEILITTIPAKWIAASFPLEKLSGKQMGVKQRKWIEKMLERLGWRYTKFKTSNEVFYLINLMPDIKSV